MIVHPGAGLSTREVYSKWDEMSASIPRVDIDRAQRALETGDTDAMFKYAKNALEPAATALMPQIAALKDELMRAGAKLSLMTGSGSAVFGVFDDALTAKKAAAAFDGRAILTRTM
ncbi:MAG: hypothetical protein Q4D04_00195 [Clostridia bacterium]|nr:hypothetical protein [Clostridia bacterium]